MITPMTSTDPLVEEIARRVRLMDLIGWQRISAWAEEAKLTFEDLRLLLVFALKSDEGPVAVSDLAELAGFSLDTAYPAIHGLRRRGYLHEDSRHYSLTEQGQELVAKLDEAHLEGVRAYVDTLGSDEQERLQKAFGLSE